MGNTFYIRKIQESKKKNVKEHLWGKEEKEENLIQSYGKGDMYILSIFFSEVLLSLSTSQLFNYFTSLLIFLIIIDL